MARQAFAAAGIFAEGGIETDRLLLVDNGEFIGFDTRENVKKLGIQVHEYEEYYILPGLFDSHIHGAMGKDTMDASAESLDIIGRYLLSCGITSWMPTTVTAPMADIENALRNVAAYQPAGDAARPMGCFVEGPYLTKEHRGAHPTEYLREVSTEEFDKLLASGSMKAVALAPEKPNALAFIDYARRHGVHISLAHTSASYEEAVLAIEHGADAAVHTYCGMSTMHHRCVNLLGAALTRDNIYAELIADGIHVSKPAMDILLRCKPKDKVILVSDAISAAGLPDGDYVLGVEAVHVKGGIPHTDSGSLAGSTTNLLAEVRRLILELGKNTLDVVHMASLNPSRRFGFDERIGSIRSGKLADFIVVDRAYQLKEVWKDGVMCFRHGGIGMGE